MALIGLREVLEKYRVRWQSDCALNTANSNGIFSFTDTNAPLFPARFYRVVWP
jgi:hypothetical protein